MLRNASDPTHVLVTRRPSDAAAPEGMGRVSAENQVVAEAMRHGSAVHVQVEQSTLDNMTPESARGLFERVTENQRLTGDPEFRVPLPAGRDAVASLLSFDPENADSHTQRIFGIAEFAVVTPESWLYRSVPHHAHIRELNADPESGFLSEVRKLLAAVPQTGVFPDGPVLTWQGEESRYELHPETIRKRRDGAQWAAFDLGRLAEVSPGAEREEVLFEWNTPDSVLWSVAVAVVQRWRPSPPKRVAVRGATTVMEVVDAFADLTETLGYEYRLKRDTEA